MARAKPPENGSGANPRGKGKPARRKPDAPGARRGGAGEGEGERRRRRKADGDDERRRLSGGSSSRSRGHLKRRREGVRSADSGGKAAAEAGAAANKGARERRAEARVRGRRRRRPRQRRQGRRRGREGREGRLGVKSSDAGPGGSSGGGTVKGGEKPDGNKGYDTAEVRGETSKGGTLQGSGQEPPRRRQGGGGGGDKITGVGGSDRARRRRSTTVKGPRRHAARRQDRRNGRTPGQRRRRLGQAAASAPMSGIKNRATRRPDEALPSRLESVGDLVKELDRAAAGRRDRSRRCSRRCRWAEDEVRDFVTRYKKYSVGGRSARKGQGGRRHCGHESGRTSSAPAKGVAGKGEGKVRLATDAVGGTRRMRSNRAAPGSPPSSRSSCASTRSVSPSNSVQETRL
jgi:hypothetical protein